MKNLIKTFSIVLASFFFSAQADELELTILDSEYWWAGLSSKGYEMPYDQSSKVFASLCRNRCSRAKFPTNGHSSSQFT